MVAISMIRMNCCVRCWKVSSKCISNENWERHIWRESICRTEDLKRYQRVILTSLNYKGQDLQSVPDEMKQKCKFYGQQASERILCPEKVFRGFLVSTLICQDCYHTKSQHENFLDLSLPLCVDKPAPPMRRKSSPEKLSPSKENALKAKAAAKAERARKTSANRSSSSEETDADVEDNVSEEVNVRQKLINGITDSNGNIETNAIKSEKQDDDPEIADKDKNGWFWVTTIDETAKKFKKIFFLFRFRFEIKNVDQQRICWVGHQCKRWPRIGTANFTRRWSVDNGCRWRRWCRTAPIVSTLGKFSTTKNTRSKRESKKSETETSHQLHRLEHNDCTALSMRRRWIFRSIVLKQFHCTRIDDQQQ